MTECSLLQPLVCGTVFHHTSLLPPSPSSAVILNHISSHFLIPLSGISLLNTVSAQWLIILDTIVIVITFNILLVNFCGWQLIKWKRSMMRMRMRGRRKRWKKRWNMTSWLHSLNRWSCSITSSSSYYSRLLLGWVTAHGQVNRLGM